MTAVIPDVDVVVPDVIIFIPNMESVLFLYIRENTQTKSNYPLVGFVLQHIACVKIELKKNHG